METVPHPPHPTGEARAALVRRAQLLAQVGLGWHVIEAAVALIAGVLASSIALIGFGADSLVEGIAGVVLIWRFASNRSESDRHERLAQRLIGLSFLAIAIYIGIEATRTLIAGEHPEISWVGIALAAFTTVTMPLLARAKRRVGRQLHSGATLSESRQTLLCAYLSAALLIGLSANAISETLWWVDPTVALVIAASALYEAHAAWIGRYNCC